GGGEEALAAQAVGEGGGLGDAGGDPGVEGGGEAGEGGDAALALGDEVGEGGEGGVAAGAVEDGLLVEVEGAFAAEDAEAGAGAGVGGGAELDRAGGTVDEAEEEGSGIVGADQ